MSLWPFDCLTEGVTAFCSATRSTSSSPQRTDVNNLTSTFAPRAMSASPVRVTQADETPEVLTAKDCFKLGISPRKEYVH